MRKLPSLWKRLPGIGVFSLLLFCQCPNASAQSDNVQYPRILMNSYVGIQMGYIKYAFSNAQLEPGFTAESVVTPHLSVGVLLFGHEFNKYLTAQVRYIRPVKWVTYRSINGGGGYHSVWTNIAGVTLKPRLPITKTLSVYGEGGLGVITRKGFEIGLHPEAMTALTDANYSGLLWGGGLQYRVNSKWDWTVGATMSPERPSSKMPPTSFFSAGFDYTMRRVTDDQVESKANNGYEFSKNIVQLGFTTDALGNGINNALTNGPVPIFWAGNVHVTHGFSANFQRNVFHAWRVFSLDWGTGLATWKSKINGERFVTASAYPVLRFTTIRSKPMDLYFDYSLAGPSYISRRLIDAEETGRHFTFQDFVAMGMFISKSRKVNAEIRISHFSNGNIFPRNAGVTVPLSLNLGYGF